MHPDDKELLEKILSKEAQAWESFVVQFMPVIQKAIQQVLANSAQGDVVDESNELITDVFLCLLENDFRRLRQFRGESRLSTWLYTVSENRTKDFLKKQKALIDIISIDDDRDQALQVPDKKLSVPENLEHIEVMRSFYKKLLEVLSDQEKVFLELHYFQEKTLQDVAGEMKISINNLYVIKHRVKKKADEVLAASGK